MQAKLVLLTLAFPALKIIWSSSPYQTASIFSELKKAAPEPDPARAVRMGLLPMTGDGDAGDGSGAGNPPHLGDHHHAATAAAAATALFGQVPQEMLRAVPGVTDKIARALMLEADSVQHVANMAEAEIAALVGNEAARPIWRFFNRSLFNDNDDDSNNNNNNTPNDTAATSANQA